MSMNIIAGYRGEAHITSQQLRNKNIGIFGDDVCILAVGSEMAATVISANEVDIADGILVAEGCTAEITHGTVEAMAIDNGAQGMLRTDLIVARYTKASGTGVEDMQLAVITGTPAASNPADPSYNTGSIAAGDTLVDFPLYKISLNGISIETVTRIPVIAGIAKTSDVSAVSAALTALSNTVTSLSNKIGSTAMGTTATTVTAAIRELLTKINTLTTNLSTQKDRIDTLVAKTNGFMSSNTYNIAANAKDYKQLAALGMYMIILNGATKSNTVRGIYLVGVTSGNALGIKAISAATGAAVDDVGNGIVRVTNSSSLTLRYTLIRMY